VVIDDPYRDAELVALYDLDNPGGDDPLPDGLFAR
jgi:hypothetical protein